MTSYFVVEGNLSPKVTSENSYDISLSSDEQLFEFIDYLKSQQPKFKVGQKVMFQGGKVIIEKIINQIVVVVREINNPKKQGFSVAINHLQPLYN